MNRVRLAVLDRRQGRDESRPYDVGRIRCIQGMHKRKGLMNSQKRTSRRTRTVTQTLVLVVLAVPFILSFSAPQQYQFWFMNAGILIIGLLLLGGGLMYQSTFADALGIVTSRSRRFYIILGIVFIVVAITAVLLNLKLL
jgi:hypothetical protein